MPYSLVVIYNSAGQEIARFTDVSGYQDKDTYIKFTGKKQGEDVSKDYEFNRTAFGWVEKTLPV